MSGYRFNRRSFLKHSAVAGGSLAAPWVMSRGLRAGESANERLGVGCMGVGGRGTLIGNTVCRLGEKVACADVNRRHAERFAGDEKLPNGYNTATQFQVTLRFANGSSMVVTEGPGNGIMLEGEEGRIYVNRARLSGKPIEELTKSERAELAEKTRELYGREIDPSDVTTDAANTGPDEATVEHMQYLFASVKDRVRPVSDVFTHQRSVRDVPPVQYRHALGSPVTLGS